MKFNQLSIGDRFIYNDLAFTKSGPLQAVAEGSSNPRLIPRSALVRPLDLEKPGERDFGTLDIRTLQAELEHYHQQCLAILTLPDGGSPSSGAREQLEKLHARMQQLLSQH
ncbi:MAG: hypothetical protein GY703_04090 [Gammaproteobacteria bacterium]|nr:hypothetical protein [Gammaproteobacteria bacterium]